MTRLALPAVVAAAGVSLLVELAVAALGPHAHSFNERFSVLPGVASSAKAGGGSAILPSFETAARPHKGVCALDIFADDPACADLVQKTSLSAELNAPPPRPRATFRMPAEKKPAQWNLRIDPLPNNVPGFVFVLTDGDEGCEYIGITGAGMAIRAGRDGVPKCPEVRQ